MHIRNHTTHFHSHHLRQNNLITSFKPKIHNTKFSNTSNLPKSAKMHTPQTATHNFNPPPSVLPPPCRPPCFLCRKTPPAPAEPATSLLVKLERLEETLKAYSPVCIRLFELGLTAGTMVILGTMMATVAVLVVGGASALLLCLLIEGLKAIRS